MWITVSRFCIQLIIQSLICSSSKSYIKKNLFGNSCNHYIYNLGRLLVLWSHWDGEQKSTEEKNYLYCKNIWVSAPCSLSAMFWPCVPSQQWIRLCIVDNHSSFFLKFLSWKCPNSTYQAANIFWYPMQKYIDADLSLPLYCLAYTGVAENQVTFKWERCENLLELCVYKNINMFYIKIKYLILPVLKIQKAAKSNKLIAGFKCE